jgi:hypothetical protein
MATLDLFAARKKHTLMLDVNGEPTEFYIPMEYTVEEVERVYELQTQIDKIAKKTVNPKTQEQDLDQFWDAVFAQLLILFNHYHPDLTLDTLKKMLSRKEAVEIIQFFAKERLSTNDQNDTGKKKVRGKSSKR